MKTNKFNKVIWSLLLISNCVFGINCTNSSFGQISINTEKSGKNPLSPDQIVLEYSKLAKDGNFLQLNNLVMMTSSSYREQRMKEIEKVIKEDEQKLNRSGAIEASPDFSILDKLTYNRIVKRQASLIHDKKMVVKRIGKSQVKKNICKILVSFISEENTKLFYTNVFFLYRDENNSWRIFDIEEEY